MGKMHLPVGFDCRVGRVCVNVELQCPFREIKMGASTYRPFMVVHARSHCSVQMNSSDLCKSFVIGSMIPAEFRMKHRLNCARPLKTCTSCGVRGLGFCWMASIFFGSGNLLSFDTM